MSRKFLKLLSTCQAVYQLYSLLCLLAYQDTGVSEYMIYTEDIDDCPCSHNTYQRMLSMLAQCEFTMEKSVQVHAMNLSEQDNYEKLSKDIGEVTQLHELCYLFCLLFIVPFAPFLCELLFFFWSIHLHGWEIAVILRNFRKTKLSKSKFLFFSFFLNSISTYITYNVQLDDFCFATYSNIAFRHFTALPTAKPPSSFEHAWYKHGVPSA